jgi:3-oxoacyl-[acyl-carrier protein] reductase
MINESTLVVVGGASGIGASICEMAHSQGWQVVSMDRTTVESVPWAQIFIDVRDAKSIAHAFEELQREHDVISALHITAGITDPTSLTQVAVEKIQQIIDINIVGAITVAQCAISMLRDYGSIVLFSSVAAHRGGGFFGASTYAASKAAVEGLTRGLARECAPRGIRANCIAPGPTATPMLMAASDEVIDRVQQSTLLGRIGHPDEIASAALFLSGPGASFITGSVLTVDGGAGLK